MNETRVVASLRRVLRHAKGTTARRSQESRPGTKSGPRTSGKFQRLVVSALGPGPARAAIVSADGRSRLGSWLAEERPDVVVTELPEAMDPWERHARFVAAGPFAVAVDVGRDATTRFDRLRDLLHLVEPGGSLLLRNIAQGPKATGPRKRFRSRLEEIGSILAGEVPEPVKGTGRNQWDLHRLAAVTDSIRFPGPHAVLTRNDTVSLAKMNEPAMNTYLAQAGTTKDRVLRVIPGEHVTPRGEVHHNGGWPKQFREEYDAPDVSLRLYHDAVAAPGQVVVKDGLVLPDSFRHNASPRLVNNFLVELAPRFADVSFGTAGLPHLQGTYFHLDSEFRGHFGHLMTEQLSRLWAWPEVKAANPDARVLMFLNRGREISDWEYTFYEAAGIAREDIEFRAEPVRVERLVSAAPMFSNPAYAHPAIRETWQRVGDGLAAGADDRRRSRRIFCSRAIAKRGCRNTDEVEALFREQGFEIVLPETMPLSEQVQLFREAEVVAGFAGSGMFHLAFTPTPKRVIMIGHERYGAANEYLMAAVLGHEIDWVTSVPDRDEFQSTFAFDHDREGRYLATVFASLA